MQSEEKELDEKFFKSCFTLSKEDILKFDEEDNGPINNVLIRLAKHCYGTRLYDDEYGLLVEMFYVNGKHEIKGDIIQLQLNDKDYFKLLLRFCNLLAENYEDVNALMAFNTFQQKLRGFLEKRKIVTVSSLELRNLKGENNVLATTNERGIYIVDFIDQKKFYREFFNNIHDNPIEIGKNYVYLMVNEETGLIKIGKSINPIYRERTLHSQEPSVHRIAMWCCDQQVEKELHKLFKHKHGRGEWFKLTLRDLAILENHMNGL